MVGRGRSLPAIAGGRYPGDHCARWRNDSPGGSLTKALGDTVSRPAFAETPEGGTTTPNTKNWVRSSDRHARRVRPSNPDGDTAKSESSEAKAGQFGQHAVRQSSKDLEGMFGHVYSRVKSKVLTYLIG